MLLRALYFSCFVILLTSLLEGCRSAALPHYPADYREYAYVANSGADTISVLDVVNLRGAGTLQVGAHPVALAASPVRNEVYAVSQGAPGGNGSLALIDAEKNQVVATLPLGKMPLAAALDPDGRRLYVANTGSNSISVIDTVARRVVGVIGTGESPSALAVSPDGETLVVSNRKSGSALLMQISGHPLPVLRTSFADCPGAGSIAVLPDSSKAYIACSAGHQVMAIGLKTIAKPEDKNFENEPDRLLSLLDVGKNPVKLLIKPDGGEIFVADQGSGTISEIATNASEVGGATLVGSRPSDGGVSADNSLLWVSNEGTDSIAVYSIDDGRVINTVQVGSGPGPLTFSADGHFLLAADTRSGDVAVVRTFSRDLHRRAVYGSLFTLLPAGPDPAAIVDKAFLLNRR